MSTSSGPKADTLSKLLLEVEASSVLVGSEIALELAALDELDTVASLPVASSSLAGALVVLELEASMGLVGFGLERATVPGLTLSPPRPQHHWLAYRVVRRIY